MTRPEKYHGGLVAFGTEDTLLDRFSRIAATTLEDYGHPVEKNTRQSERAARVTATHYALRLTLTQGMHPSQHGHRAIRLDPFAAISAGHAKDTHMQWRVQIEMIPADPARDDRDISELLLAIMLYRMIDAADVRMIEWLDPLTLLTRDQFIEAFGNISPDLVKAGDAIGDVNNPRFAPVDEMSQFYEHHHGAPRRARAIRFRGRSPRPRTVHRRDREDGAPSDVQRLATWGMTGTIACLSMPVAASMAAVNLLRGEDFRLNTHVLSLTGMLVMLHSSGALDQIVNQILS